MGKFVTFCIIAMQGNRDSLLNRCIPSVLAQQAQIDCLLLISNPGCHIDSTILTDIQNRLPDSSLLQIHTNDRTKNIAGSWNAGISHALSLAENPKETYIALLNEEDIWLPEHLSICLHSIPKFDVIVTNATGTNTNGYLLEEASTIQSLDHLLKKVPKIQSSRLCFRLSSILSAGLFDENLSNALVCDLLIRLLEIGAKIHSLEKKTASLKTVNNEQLSEYFTPEHYQQSLRSFEDKYWPRLTPMPLKEFNAKSETNNRIIESPSKLTKFQLVLGVISSEPVQLARFLKGLTLIVGHEVLSTITILIVANRGLEKAVRTTISENLPKGIRYKLISDKDYLPNATLGAFGPCPQTNEGMLDIVNTRTILQKYLSAVMEQNPGSIGWIIDEDMTITPRTSAFLAWLPEFQRAGIDVLLGTFEGDSPNPGPNGLRVQLVDLLHNLERLHNSGIGGRTGLEEENKALRKAFPDYYYDLSRKHKGHLETPFWINLNELGKTTDEVRKNLIDISSAVLKGVCFTRPLISDIPNQPLDESFASCNRGGHTVVFNWRALAQSPNLAIHVDCITGRRSDMIWAIINRYRNDMNIQRVNFPILHSRAYSTQNELGRSKVVGEIFGSAIFAGLDAFLQNMSHRSFSFKPDEMEEIASLTLHFRNQRLFLLRENWYRIQGLIDALEKYNVDGELNNLLMPLRKWVTQENWTALENECSNLTREHIFRFLNSIESSITSYETTHLLPGWEVAEQ